MTDARLFTEVFMTKGKILDRPLPSYTWRQEAFNSISHAFGVAFGVLTLALCVGKSIAHGSLVGTVSSVIYGVSMILVYLVSALYHGAKIGKGKKILRICDHCTIFLLIAGTYTPITLCSLCSVNRTWAMTLLVLQWLCAAVGIVLNIKDMHKFAFTSMICYIISGVSVLFRPMIAIEALGSAGFAFVAGGGACYIIGAALYGVGKLSDKLMLHGVFHLFVLAGSILQLTGIYFYVL